MRLTFSGRAPGQDMAELDSFVHLMRTKGVKRYGEIGARYGDSFHYIVSALGCAGVALDLPNGPWGRRSLADLETAVADLRRMGLEATAVIGNSQSAGVRKQFRALGPYDAILIDGDHTYEGVKADWDNYRSMARIVAFHDIVGEGRSDKAGNRVEVPRLWKEIKAQHETVEFVTPGGCMGIGVVLLGDAQ